MKTEHFMVSTLDFFRVFFVKNFFPKFDLLNSGCGLSASAAYLRVFTVFSSFGIKEITPHLCDIDSVPLSRPTFNESKSAEPIRSKKAS